MNAPDVPGVAPRVSTWDSVRFNVLQTVPQFLRGMFKRRPGWSSFLDRVLSDPQGVRLVAGLRSRYRSDYLWLSVLGKPTLLVLDLEGIRRVLDTSPEVYGPPDIKVRGMSHFQPDAVTVSTGDDWIRRRAFTDEVLAPPRPSNARDAEFLEVVRSTLAPTTSTDAPLVTWETVQAGFQEITAGVVFGTELESDSVLARLDTLMRRANRIVGRSDTPERNAFHEEIRKRLCDPRAAGLAAAACPHLAAGGSLPVAGLVPHWLFAMKDTLALNCANAFALIAAHPEAQERARNEAVEVDLSDPEAVGRMPFLEGCLRDTMRLWPTTPLIVRKALKDDALAGHEVPAGAQVLIHNGFNHRNPDTVDHPDAFRPEAWEQGVWDYRFNPLSNGPQACAGRELVLFLGKAVLGGLLQRHGWTLSHPSLDPQRPIPQAFDTRSVVLEGRSIQAS